LIPWRQQVSILHTCLENIQTTNAMQLKQAPDALFAELRAEIKRLKISRGTVFFIGNGASASMSSHMQADFAKNGHVHTETFTDLSLLTAIANDIGYEHIFAYPLKNSGKKGDLLVAISSSGQSDNILNGVRTAKDLGMTVCTLSGMQPNNPLRQLGDLNIYVPSDAYGVIETAHATILHYWMDLISPSPAAYIQPVQPQTQAN